MTASPTWRTEAPASPLFRPAQQILDDLVGRGDQAVRMGQHPWIIGDFWSKPAASTNSIMPALGSEAGLAIAQKVALRKMSGSMDGQRHHCDGVPC